MQCENDVERYLKELGELLPGTKAEKRRFLDRMAENIMQYEEEAGIEADYRRLVTYFGSPATIAKDYAGAWEEELKHDAAVAANSPWVKIAFWICVAVLLTCIVWVIYHSTDAFGTYASHYGVTRNN